MQRFLLGLVAGSLVLVAHSTTLAAPSPLGSTPTILTHGKLLYATHCASCHGVKLTGSAGAPSLIDSGGSGIDFYLTTGRMPSAVKNLQAVHATPQLNPSDIGALDAYVDSKARTHIPIPKVIVDHQLLREGRSLFEEHCQACHGVAGGGATAGEAWTAVPLNQANPTQIGEAIRYGPGVMPRFTTAQLSERDIDVLATYISYLNTDAPAYGGFTLQYLGPVAEGLVGLVGIGVLVCFIVYTGTKVDDAS